jgi:hypothetical protein
MADLSSQIDAVAAGPASVSGDAGSVTAQPLGALQAADRYQAARAARANKRRGVMFNKLIPAGALCDNQATGLGPSGFASPGGTL